MALLAVPAVPSAAAAAADSVAVTATAVPLYAGDPTRTSAGALSYRGGLVLTSQDRRFGGLSGMSVSPDGAELLAISDEGYWLKARLTYDARGFLAGLAGVELRPMLGLDGLPPSSKTDADAEAMAVMPDGAVIVGFEQRHRLWVYRGRPLSASRPQTFTPPPDFEKQPANGGFEAVAGLRDGSLLAISEEMMEQGRLRAWLWREGQWSILRYAPLGSPKPSDAAVLPSGDVLVLERSYTPITGLRLQVRRLRAGCIRPGATLSPPVIAQFDDAATKDNFEGIAARTSPAGETLVYVVSDDNYSPLQKTLLMMFALDPAEAEPVGGCD